VYGLGAIAEHEEAVERIFVAKNRPDFDPLIVHVAPDLDLTGIVDDPPPLFHRLARQHWPGPLTLVVRRGERIPPIVTAGLDTVAIRSPAHPVAAALLQSVRAPVAAPSANLFGQISPTNADHVLDDLSGRCDLVLDAGDSSIGIESTVVAVESDHVVLLRPGAVAAEDLDIEVRAPSDTAGSPGMTERHYSPRSAMAVMDPRERHPLPPGGGVYLGFDETARSLPEGWDFVPLGSRDFLAAVAARLYRVMRSVDRAGPALIVAELSGRDGLGAAIDDRLTRAAGGRTI
jgi:L-threonylcarbamoyladenylate synthase